MPDNSKKQNDPYKFDTDHSETKEWTDSFESIIKSQGNGRAHFLLKKLIEKAQSEGVRIPFEVNTPYQNTIPKNKQPAYPGDRDIERRNKSIIRWNAMAMVVHANKVNSGIGGHISTYASAATLLEVGFNHFFKGKGDNYNGDLVYFQGHASPGIYARAFLEGRLSADHLHNFRQDLSKNGLSSYPHPWLMDDFWEFPTVSMGLSPIMAIYQARFNKYLHNRGIKDTSGQKIWAYLGDGETDEPESLGALSLASREELDNLIFVVNCNLQRLDGPVRGNGKIIQELESVFNGNGWNVIKVVWGSDWDPIFEKDVDGKLVERMGELVDGEFQKMSVESGAYVRKYICGDDPDLHKLLEGITDNQLRKLRRGGHDPEKVYTAYKAAIDHKGGPTVVLAKTIKGYGLGEAGEGRNISHQQKKLNESELREFRARFGIPISDEQLLSTPLYRPADDSPEVEYINERRKALNGYIPTRLKCEEKLIIPGLENFKEFFKGTGDHSSSTTMVFVRFLGKLLKDKNIGERIVPIIPDEARTFGMDALFRQIGIYASKGQLYDPVDSETLLYYKEAIDGQILEEGLTEAGAMSSFIAAGTSHSSHGKNMIPFYTFYSMFGFQRIGDQIWAASDMRCKGFLCGATAGRTTLNGEGLQHQDGHSLILASTVPTVKAYDPAFNFDIAVIMQNGLKRMYEDGEELIYYITLENENYPHPVMPKGVEDGILKGIYKFKSTKAKKGMPHVQLFGSGSIIMETLKAQEILADEYGIGSDLWNATSYKELREDAISCDRWNRLNPDKTPKVPYITQQLKGAKGPVIAASDYMRINSDQVDRWVPGGVYSLGTDGFGRSDTREKLRSFFEVNAESIVCAALYNLLQQKKVKIETLKEAYKKFDIDLTSIDPWLR